MRLAPVLLLLACAHGPHSNELVAKVGRQEAWRAQVVSATFCSTCGRDAPVKVDFKRLVLTIPVCYAHAQSKVGDHDQIRIERDDHAVATAGELDITDCTSKHVIATLWASFPDGQRVNAVIDTDLREP